MSEWSMLEFPKIIGYWVISRGQFCTKFGVLHKPNWLHRTMARLLLGWEWEDVP